MKHVIFALSLMALVSCKDSKSEDTKKESVEHSTAIHNNHHDHEVSGIYANAWMYEIKLNDGAKWKADATTSEGVQKLKKTINTETASTLKEYHKLAEQLNDEKNFLVKNCSMKGPSHDNLHVWLHPLIEKIDALLKAKTVDDASKLKQSIKDNINAYNTYFQ